MHHKKETRVFFSDTQRSTCWFNQHVMCFSPLVCTCTKLSLFTTKEQVGDSFGLLKYYKKCCWKTYSSNYTAPPFSIFFVNMFFYLLDHAWQKKEWKSPAAFSFLSHSFKKPVLKGYFRCMLRKGKRKIGVNPHSTQKNLVCVDSPGAANEYCHFAWNCYVSQFHVTHVP